MGRSLDLSSTRRIILRLLPGLVALFVLAGCGTEATPTPTATQLAATVTSAPVAEDTPTQANFPTATRRAPTATATAIVVPEGQFLNPVIKGDFPDPGIINVDGVYYAYATNAGNKNVQVARSNDLVNWEMLRDALPGISKWASLQFGNVWAPEVMKIGEQYVMYYTARDKASNKQCIGLATSPTPEGPFHDTRTEPFVCQPEQGGSIDAAPFRDGDKLYLYWKNDGNCCGGITYLYAQEMSADGLSLIGEPTQLVKNDERWEGIVIEAPTMWKQGDTYYLFFSGNIYNGLDYAVGYATCQSPTGPCQDAEENPILKTSLERPPVISPGHQTVIADDDGELWLVYHAWESPPGPKPRRFVWLDRLEWKGGKPDVLGPTTSPQPVP
ncbi:MAG: glycoside hydrolase family 43 protein [Chloroflexota bacterium]|nr:glycoside hydrolase family 43 protein [Chloroflexota bacterium]MDQ5867267.1 glycoside hydrolase family 43 protein [Chloroflexota bacterium]